MTEERKTDKQEPINNFNNIEKDNVESNLENQQLQDRKSVV